MNIAVHRPIGVTVSGLSVRDVDPDLAEEFKDLLAEHGVVHLPDQDVDDAEFVAFLHHFGELTFTEGETPVDGSPDLNVVSNVGRTTPPRSSFHVDTSYVARPPAYTALRAVQVPVRGGATQFTDQFHAHDTLPAELRTDLATRTITHVVTGVTPGGDAETAADHPVLRPHPRTGRSALYLSTPARCAAVSGLDPTRAGALVEHLYTHSTDPDNTFTHHWSPGDVVIWDNARVLHRADHSGVEGDRVLHRGMVAADGHGRAGSSGGSAHIADIRARSTMR